MPRRRARPEALRAPHVCLCTRHVWSFPRHDQAATRPSSSSRSRTMSAGPGESGATPGRNAHVHSGGPTASSCASPAARLSCPPARPIPGIWPLLGLRNHVRPGCGMSSWRQRRLQLQLRRRRTRRCRSQLLLHPQRSRWRRSGCRLGSGAPARRPHDLMIRNLVAGPHARTLPGTPGAAAQQKVGEGRGPHRCARASFVARRRMTTTTITFLPSKPCNETKGKIGTRTRLSGEAAFLIKGILAVHQTATPFPSGWDFFFRTKEEQRSFARSRSRIALAQHAFCSTVTLVFLQTQKGAKNPPNWDV